MEGEAGAEINLVSDSVDHNLITIGHNTSCNRGDCCLHYCSKLRPLGILVPSDGSSEW